MGFPWGYPPPLSYHIEGMLVPVSATILYHYPYLRSYLWWHRSLTGSYSIPWVGTDMITMYLLPDHPSKVSLILCVSAGWGMMR